MKNIVTQREIKFIWHFTRYENLDSILTNGLLSRKELLQSNTPFIYNDEHRLDRCENSVSCSIEFPNYKMFYPCRQNNSSQKWILIGVQSTILWDLDCAFCMENAASNSVTSIWFLPAVKAS